MPPDEPANEARIAMDRISAIFYTTRFIYGDEKGLQSAIALLLKEQGVSHVREKELGVGPVDFFLNEDGIGLEIKVKGSPSQVLAQLMRYAERPEINGILLVTTKCNVGRFVPSVLSGKPAGVISLWQNGF